MRDISTIVKIRRIKRNARMKCRRIKYGGVRMTHADRKMENLARFIYETLKERGDWIVKIPYNKLDEHLDSYKTTLPFLRDSCRAIARAIIKRKEVDTMEKKRIFELSSPTEYLMLQESDRGDGGIDILITDKGGNCTGGVIINLSNRGIWINNQAVSSIVPREGGLSVPLGRFAIAKDKSCGRFKVIHEKDC